MCELWLDNQNCGRPERRTAIVARQLARYDIDIAAFSETRFPEKGSSGMLVGGSYTFSGKEHQWQIIEYME